MSLKNLRFDTLQAHAGQVPDPATGSRAVPIYQTTSYTFESVEDAAEIFALRKEGNIYTRINNPTTDVLEKRVAALEGGVSAVAFASGMAAITAAICNLAVRGEEIVAASTLYGGTHTLFVDRFPTRHGIQCRLVDIDDFDALESAINDKTRAVYFETLGNPNINIPDIEAVCKIAHKYGLPVICDNTFGTPYLVRLKDWGVDICVHSATKYLGGHGTSVAGIVVDYGTFPWKGNARFADFNDPDPGYHGIVYADLGADAFAKKLRAQILRDEGACLSPFNAFLILLGVETLSLRVERHCRNAERIAEFLSESEYVSWVNYPYLKNDRYRPRMEKYMPKGCGSILTFGIRGGLEAGRKFIEHLTIFSHLANVADAKSLIIHPASTTHSQLDEEALAHGGISADMIRVSVGLEDAEDLIEDLENALRLSQQ
ncbi:MAG: O-acetylhomoserine aminocarboxypropyltransferase/cysteine synthase family protein [Christensenellales bacterium]|jgi:O-acetylhomoserine (thiol)-lyase